jgi:ABC-2 type transport system ATP-binding protein
MAAPAVEITDLSHRYGDHTALQGVGLAINAGALYGLLGPNGSGKTTLFRILSTLMPPSEGTAAVFGADTAGDPDGVRRQLGVVFQHLALDENLTVRENLRFQGALYGLGGAPLDDRIDTLLGRFGVADRASDRVKTLSGGLQRRVDLARGLLHAPKLLLLDEPTTGLDPVARRTFWEALARLRADEGTTMLVATHLMEEAARCDAVAILDQGRLVAEGAPDDLTAALGGTTLWLTAADAAEPQALRDHIEAQFGLDVRVIGTTLHLAHADAPALLSSLYDALGDQIASATVRAPTLEDVFMVHAGRTPDALAPAPGDAVLEK